MSVMNTKGVLTEATEKRFSLCAYNVDTLDYMRAVVSAAEQEEAPIILSVVETALRDLGLKNYAIFARQLAESATVPVGIHLDHGSSVEWAKACLDSGFTSVMIDASHLSLSKNIHMTIEVVKLAEKYGAFTEGEIGHIPGIEEGVGGSEGDFVFTDPEDAHLYCKETGVNSLAVSIGTVHYMRKEPLVLDFNLLRRIKESVTVPLVLHGGAAVIDEDMKRAVQEGIAKYNIAYKGYRAYVDGIKNAVNTISEDIAPGKIFISPSAVIASGLDSAKREIRSKIRLLGGSGMARGTRIELEKKVVK